MAKFKLEDYFIYKNVTPSSLQENNIIQFSYKSPAGVHDKSPLVLVTAREGDRIYGINLNYDSSELNEAVTNLEIKLLVFLEKEYFKKYPDNKKKLNEQHIKFNKSLITEAEYKEFIKRFPRKELEVFDVTPPKNSPAFRQYLYQRMTAVSKLVWK